MTADPLAVAAALEASMAAHNQAKGNPRPANYKESLQRAYTLRQTAQELDPGHEAPAWKWLAVTHKHGLKTQEAIHVEMLAWYESLGLKIETPEPLKFSEKLHMRKAK